MTLAWQYLTQHGWVEQDIPGLWRHPWKASGRELTTAQAMQVENGPPLPEDEIRAIAMRLI